MDWRGGCKPPRSSVIPPFEAPCPSGADTPGPGLCGPAFPGPSRSPLTPLPRPQVIIIQPQVQTQPESTAESRPPTEEPSQGAQATKKKKEDRPPSQENPEVGGCGLGAAVGHGCPGSGDGPHPDKPRAQPPWAVGAPGSTGPVS